MSRTVQVCLILPVVDVDFSPPATGAVDMFVSVPSIPRGFVFALLTALCLTVLTTGCASSGASNSGASTSAAGERAGSSVPARATTSAEPERSGSEARAVESDLRSEAASWEGVPHRWGGTTRRGIDCSGLTQVMYARVLGLNLPRDTERQARTGERVRRSALQPGDLVFFKTGRKTRHVGVYLSGNEFVHASSSSGVTISSLETDYWRRTWWHARRVLPNHQRISPDASPAPSTDSAQPSRAGW